LWLVIFGMCYRCSIKHRNSGLAGDKLLSVIK
jgi:hypothetical protein